MISKKGYWGNEELRFGFPWKINQEHVGEVFETKAKRKHGFIYGWIERKFWLLKILVQVANSLHFPKSILKSIFSHFCYCKIWTLLCKLLKQTFFSEKIVVSDLAQGRLKPQPKFPSWFINKWGRIFYSGEKLKKIPPTLLRTIFLLLLQFL